MDESRAMRSQKQINAIMEAEKTKSVRSADPAAYPDLDVHTVGSEVEVAFYGTPGMDWSEERYSQVKETGIYTHT